MTVFIDMIRAIEILDDRM